MPFFTDFSHHFLIVIQDLELFVFENDITYTAETVFNVTILSSYVPIAPTTMRQWNSDQKLNKQIIRIEI